MHCQILIDEETRTVNLQSTHGAVIIHDVRLIVWMKNLLTNKQWMKNLLGWWTLMDALFRDEN